MKLFSHQEKAIELMKDGCILRGGVGSGKTLTALAYFVTKVCGGSLGSSEMKHPRHLYVITTPKKRDDLDWYEEAAYFGLSKDKESSINGIEMVVDSWNNIQKYINVKDAFFIFDEQRAIGAGSWAKSFIKITVRNRWVMLSATPGDVWTDYIPVFIANGFHRNRREFVERHVVYSPYTKFPKILKFIDTEYLVRCKEYITVNMSDMRQTVRHHEYLAARYPKILYDTVSDTRLSPKTKEPFRSKAELFIYLRELMYTDPSRLFILSELMGKHPRLIVFYNFNHELDILREFLTSTGITFAEWNGKKHQTVPNTKEWVYLVQYTAGAEGWNCTSTNAILFFSQNYSYKITEQARGRIDRINTKYIDLYYYTIICTAPLDQAVRRALRKKKNFNEGKYYSLVYNEKY